MSTKLPRKYPLISKMIRGASLKLHRDVFLYMEPPADWDEDKQAHFAQCATCTNFTGKSCAIFGAEDKQAVAPEDTCALYVQGTPHEQDEKELVKPETAGFAKAHASRCENCRSFSSGTCMLYTALNESQPDLFDLDTAVVARGCCNGQENPE